MTEKDTFLIKAQDLILTSNILIKQKEINEEEFLNYNKKTNELFIQIIKKSQNSSLKENAIKGLIPYKNKPKISCILSNWIYFLMIKKAAFNFNLPFLTGKTKTDKYKRNIYKILLQLEAINFKLSST